VALSFQVQLSLETLNSLETSMKKILVLLLFTVCASAMAQHPGHGNRNGHGYRPGAFGHHYGHHQGHWSRGHSGNWVWMVPALIGSAIIYESARQQPQVIIQQPLVMPPQSAENCSPWTEVQSSDGTITRTRTCTQ